MNFYGHAADKSLEIQDKRGEAASRYNRAGSLNKLRRFEEARVEATRAIEIGEAFGHASQPWNSWDLLANIEIRAGNHSPAFAARDRAIAAYLSYRRAGGENLDGPGRQVIDLVGKLRDDSTGGVAFLDQLFRDPDPITSAPFFPAFKAIVEGSRALDDDRGLHYQRHAELLLLIESLPKSR